MAPRRQLSLLVTVAVLQQSASFAPLSHAVGRRAVPGGLLELRRGSASPLTRCAAKGKKKKKRKTTANTSGGGGGGGGGGESTSPPPPAAMTSATEDVEWSAPRLPGEEDDDEYDYDYDEDDDDDYEEAAPAPRMGSMPGWYSGSSAEDVAKARQGGTGAAAASSFASRLEAEGRAMTPELEESLGALTIADRSVGGSDDDMLADIAEFRRERVPRPGELEDDGKDGLRRVVNVCGTVLSYNFVVIIGFFLWFLAGCFGKFVLKSDVVIDSFTGKWEVLILPLLSTHMGLTFFSAGIEKFGGLSEEPA